jgi:predicted transcriptional regulator
VAEPTAADMAWLSAQVPKDLKDAMERIAGARDRSVSAEVRQAIRAHVENHDSEPTGAAA